MLIIDRRQQARAQPLHAPTASLCCGMSDDEGLAGVPAVVADCGSHSCRMGMSNELTPRVNFASVVGSAKDVVAMRRSFGCATSATTRYNASTRHSMLVPVAMVSVKPY